jgi:DNA-binding MarR family transcriptional regulator
MDRVTGIDRITGMDCVTGMDRVTAMDRGTGMDRVTDAAAAVESTVDSLVTVLDVARMAQSPAVPPTQLRVLTIVAANRHTNMNRLAEALGVVPSSASRLCDRLEATGLLRRAPDPRDRREVRLVLTSAARRMLDELRERRRDALAEVLGRMTPAGRQELVRALAAFDAAVEAGAGQDDAASEDLRSA